MRRLVVGLTGGIGSGKSTALAAFEDAGAEAVSCDRLAHELSEPGRPLHRALYRAFGPRYFDRNGRLDRRALARHVFSRPSERRRLERLTHPPILRELERRVAAARKKVVVIDVPLLFEASLAARFDVTVLVSAPEEAAARRVMRRDGAALAQIRRRQRSQMPLAGKLALADVVIRNEGRVKDLRSQVKEYYRAFELIATAA